MMLKKLYLHVGTHKTGTTSFQEYLRQNHVAMAAMGCLPLCEDVPVARGKEHLRYNFAGLAHLYLREGVLSPARWSGRIGLLNASQIAGYEDRLLQLVQNVPHESILISAESFTFLRTAVERSRLARLVGKFCRDVTVVASFRNDKEWRRSWSGQIAKDPIFQRITKLLPDEFRPDGEWYFDKEAITSFWNGIGDFEVVAYEEKADITSRLVELMGLGHLAPSATPRLNVS